MREEIHARTGTRTQSFLPSLFDPDIFQERKVAHTGMNVHVQELLVNERHAVGTSAWERLGAVMAQLRLLAVQLRDGERPRPARGRLIVTVAFFCKWGKHRSVAMAHMFF